MFCFHNSFWSYDNVKEKKYLVAYIIKNDLILLRKILMSYIFI